MIFPSAVAAKLLRELGTPCLIHRPKYHLFERVAECGLIEVLRREGVGGIAFCPLAQGLLTGRYLGWVWLDPVIGIVGALVIAQWSIGLMRTAGSVLLDMVPDQKLAAAVLERLETDGDRVADLHLGPVI